MYHADLMSTYEYERKVLKLLQWGAPTRPWRLKCPTHLLFIEYFDRVFPDARYVMTHRDPTEVIVSASDLTVEVGRAFSDDIDPHYWGKCNVEHWATGMERLLKFRNGEADRRFFDIDFRAMQTDPIGQVRELYGWLGQPVTDEFENGMKRWWKQNAETRTQNVHPDASIFGIDLEEVRSLFSDYTMRMNQWVDQSRGVTT
jgi:hypothetical protein